MPYGPETGIGPQRVASALRSHIANRVKMLTLGPMVEQGRGAALEFSFIVEARDGSEMVVSVLQTKQPTRKEEPGAYTPAVMAKRWIERKQQQCVEAQEARQRRMDLRSSRN